ncbi:MAG: large-conductance mechanosensitive channel protein MscL [Mycobacteriaceae bacterium]
MLKGFKDFLLRGNIVDLAVAVVIGAAFTAVVTAFTTAVINPLIARLGGDTALGFGFQLGVEGNEKTFINLGTVVTAGINFVIIAAVVYFLVVVPVTKMQERRAASGEAAADPTETELLADIRDLLAAQANTGRHSGLDKG